MKKKFWVNKNVFITGINGFVAGNLSKLLIKNGYNVFGLHRSIKRKSFIFYETCFKASIFKFGKY